MNHEEKINCPSEKTEETEVVVDTEPTLISDEEAAQAVGGSGGSTIKIRWNKPKSIKPSVL